MVACLLLLLQRTVPNMPHTIIDRKSRLRKFGPLDGTRPNTLRCGDIVPLVWAVEGLERLSAIACKPRLSDNLEVEREQKCSFKFQFYSRKACRWIYSRTDCIWHLPILYLRITGTSIPMACVSCLSWEICRQGVNASQGASIIKAVLCLSLLVPKLEVSRLRRNLTKGLFLEPQLSSSQGTFKLIVAFVSVRDGDVNRPISNLTADRFL